MFALFRYVVRDKKNHSLKTMMRIFNFVKPDQYEKYFGVQRYISFVESELDMAEYLCVNSTKLIGEGVYRRPPNEVEKEIYSLSRKRRNKRLIGYISEYNTLAVDQKFKDLLMLESILGIDLNKKVLKKQMILK